MRKISIFAPFWAPRAPKRTRLASKGPKMGPKFKFLANLTCDLSKFAREGHLAKSGPSGPFKSLWGPQKGLLGPKQALLGALGAQKRPDTRSKCLVTMIPAQSYQLAAIGTKSGPSGPSKSLWGPQKGLLGPKQALSGALGAQKRPDTRSKCLVTMIPAQSDQLPPVGTKSGLSGPSKSLWGPQKGL